MTKYKGTAFGLNYDIEFDTEEEFLAWFIAKLKKMNPILPKLLDAILNESAEFNALKEKVAP